MPVQAPSARAMGTSSPAVSSPRTRHRKVASDRSRGQPASMGSEETTTTSPPSNTWEKSTSNPPNSPRSSKPWASKTSLISQMLGVPLDRSPSSSS